jgi:hypothetical protein
LAWFYDFKGLVPLKVWHTSRLPTCKVCDFQSFNFLKSLTNCRVANMQSLWLSKGVFPWMFDKLQSCQLAKFVTFEGWLSSNVWLASKLPTWQVFWLSKGFFLQRVDTLLGCPLAWFYDFKGLLPLKVWHTSRLPTCKVCDFQSFNFLKSLTNCRVANMPSLWLSKVDFLQNFDTLWSRELKHF